MDKRTIYSKTGKGSLEISKKTIKLAGDERQTLILVDGKSNVGEIEEKLSRVSTVRLRAILDRLNGLDLIREFVTKQGPDSIMPTLGGPTAMRVEELGEEDLDFTALASVANGSDGAQEVEERRQAAQRAADEAAHARAEEAQHAAAEAARRKAAEEAQQRAAAEAAERKRAEEEAAARARAEEESLRRAQEEARRKFEEDSRRKAAEEAAARARAEEDARRRAEEEARRKAEEEARRKADDEARRKADDEARRRAAEEARRKAEDEARRRADEEARQRAEEQRLREEAEQQAREQTRAREHAREETEARERARREEEAKRAAIVEEKRRREAEAAERRAAEEAQARERIRLDNEAGHNALAEEKRRRASEDAEGRASREAARYTAALTPMIEEAAAGEPPSLDLDFHAHASPPPAGSHESFDLKPLKGGGPDTFADTGMSGNSIFQAELTDDDKARKRVEKDARRELEREAQENAKSAAKAKKDAEREAKRLTKESRVKVRRGGGVSLGKIIGIFVVLMIAGGVGYLYFMPVDKALIESVATARLGVQVKVGSAKFDPFPPQLRMTDVVVDDIVLPRVVAVPDPGSLAADHKIWNSIDVGGATLTLRQVEKLAAIGLREPPKGVPITIQRVRVTGLTLTGTTVPVPPMDATALLGADGVKQVTFVLPDGKGQLQLSVDDKGWLVDFESRGIAWGLGPKTPWESIRAKGVANAGGIKFESIALTHFGGNANGAGELAWADGWKFGGNMDIGGMESGSIGQAYYGATPVSGTVDGKFRVIMAAPSLAQLVESTQLEGALVVNKPLINTIELARSAQAGAAVPGQTRLSDLAADLVTNGAKMQIKNIRANSGLLNVSGNVEVGADKSLGGLLNIELGISSNRTKAALKVSGTPADPKLSK